MRKTLTGAVLLLLMLITGVYQDQAQTIPLQRYTAEDGLPSNTIYSIARQANGYLLFSTDKGLALFNGTTFQTYTMAEGLPDNEIFNVREDYEGRLWVITFNGELCFLKDNIAHTSKNTPWLKLPFSSNQLSSFLQKDSSVNIVFTDQTRFVSILHNRVRTIPLLYPRAIYGDLINAISLPGNNYRLEYLSWYITVDSTGHSTKPIMPRNRGQYFQSPSFSLGGTDHYFADDTIFTMQNKVLAVWKKTKMPRYFWANIKVTNNNAFIGLPQGFVINDSIFLPTEQRVTFIETDPEGDIWIATRGKGLYRCSKYFQGLEEYRQTYSGQVVYARVWDNALYFVNNTTDLYQLNDGQTAQLAKGGKRDIVSTRANFLITDSGSLLQALSKYSYVIPSLKDRREMHFTGPADLFLQGELKELLCDGPYVYAVGISDILKYKYADVFHNANPKADTIDHMNQDPSLRIYSRTIDKSDHTLWYSRKNKVYQVKGNTSISQPQFHNTTFRQFAFGGQYCIGITEGNQLLICNNYKSKDIIIDTVPQPNCIWEYIYPIDQDHMIITTNNYHRVLTLHPGPLNRRPQYTLLALENPFIPRQVEYIATSPDNCYFFKDGTITRVGTKILFEQKAAPKTVFVSLKTVHRTYPIRTKITIPYAESQNIALTFDNISFDSKEIDCEYSFSDDGTDKWTKISGNALNLNNPGFGSFTLKIRARTLASSYSQAAVMQLVILKPFWATWWFIALASLVLIALIWLLIYLVTWYRLRKKQKEHDADMKYQQSEYKALNALMNPHFIFNSLNNIQGLINKDEKRIANEYLVIFSDLVRQNMHNISQGFISLQQELNLIENYLNLEKLRFRELVNYELIVDEEVDTDDIMIPPLMIQPLVENAVKHGLLPKQSTDSIVHIHAYEEDDYLYIEIRDNGIGLTKSLLSKNRLYESFGLSNLKKRIEHLKRIQRQEINIEVTEIKDEQGDVKGTRALITIALILSK